MKAERFPMAVVRMVKMQADHLVGTWRLPEWCSEIQALASCVEEKHTRRNPAENEALHVRLAWDWLQTDSGCSEAS